MKLRTRWTFAIPIAAAFILLSPAISTGQSSGQIARSDQGVVVAAQPLAAAAGARVLELGGNAADAAVAAAFAISVVEPSMNSIGGRNQILIRTPDGHITGIDGTTTVPQGYDPNRAPTARHGYETIGVPGSVAGLMRLHSEYGLLPLEVVMAPAIDYARYGFRLLPGEAQRQAGSRTQIAEFEGTRRYYLKADGSSYAAGDLLVQADLSHTLEAIARGGRDAFYKGNIADKIAADMAANGGFVTQEALDAYTAMDSRIVHGTYRGFELVGSGIPASGSIAIAALQIAENFDPDSMSSEAWATVIGQSIASAFTAYDRPDSDSAAVRVTSKKWARQMARGIRVPEISDSREPASRASTPGQNQTHATISNGNSAYGSSLLPDQDHTTHLSVADRNAMAVAVTQTIGPSMGSKVATPGLGFLYAVTLGGYLGLSEPGERARSGITPFMVLQEGEPVLVLGAAGGLRIISAVVQIVTRVIDDGLSLPEALAAPRIHPEMSRQQGVFPEQFSGALSVEAGEDHGWSSTSLEKFEALGIKISPTPTRGAFGRIHGLQFNRVTGTWTGAADPAWEGAAVTPRVSNREN